MSKRKLLLSGLCALTGALFIHVYLSDLEREASGGTKIPVLVIARDVPAGVVLDREHLATKEIPAAYVMTRQIEAKDLDQVIGARVTAGLKAEDSLEWTDLTTGVSLRRELAGLIQEGMRAFSIKADNLFDGLLRPGDHVDVLFSEQQGSEVMTTSTLLEDLLVLSIGGYTDRALEKAEERENPTTVALSVTPLQSQILANAGERGHLQLTLRNPNDTSTMGNLAPTSDSLRSKDNLAITPPSRGLSDRKDIEHVH